MIRLSRLALFLALLIGAASASLAAKAEGWPGTYDGLLRKYATTSGVKYAAWKANAADMQALQTVVDGIAAEKVGSLGQQEQLAFYINAYNAWILHEALAKYPTKSVKDPLFTFFTGKRIKVAGEETSFKSLETDVIRKKFGEPRIHFALNCASRSCPPLAPELFRAENLDALFEKLAKGYVNSEKGVTLSADKKTVQLSEIFKWYKDDFKEGGPIAFINKRRATPLPDDAKIAYQSYDWSLNDAK
ncbi:MAG: DUF547 domain-containing protein [Chthoniobacterales bacterium]